jgi:hypothetical protein
MLSACQLLRVETLGTTNPAPSEPLSENTTGKRTQDGSDRIHGSDHTEILQALRRRCSETDNAEQANSHSGATNPLNRSTDNQRGWILCYGVDDAAKLKD